MAGPYNIPLVSYGGDAPDPVEHANGHIKPVKLTHEGVEADPLKKAT